jgi:hypothetical protein
MMGLGDDASDLAAATIATAALNDATTAYVASQAPSCAAGYTPVAGGCQLTSAVTGTVSASGSPGLLIILAIGAYLLMQGKH